MADLTFEEIVQAAQKLTPPQKAALIQTLREDENDTRTREKAIAKLEALRAAGAFDHVESLAGKYARPGIDISEEDLNDYLHEVSTEWEQELDDLIDHD